MRIGALAKSPVLRASVLTYNCKEDRYGGQLKRRGSEIGTGGIMLEVRMNRNNEMMKREMKKGMGYWKNVRGKKKEKRRSK